MLASMQRGWLILCGAAALSLLPTAAYAQAIQGCNPGQYVDRTAANANRTLPWDFSILSNPDRCMQVRAGQTVLWDGDLDSHPLGAQGGDSPNPIAQHQDGSVKFTTAGTFGYVCLAHSSMRGAIQVLPALPAAQPAPATTPGLVLTLMALLTGSALVLLRRRKLA